MTLYVYGREDGEVSLVQAAPCKQGAGAASTG